MFVFLWIQIYNPFFYQPNIFLWTSKFLWSRAIWSRLLWYSW
jgi:hypothetical protein